MELFPLFFGDFCPVLRSLFLSLALACVAWTAPVLANIPSPFVITPERRALLNTIRFAEGTWKQGLEGYQVLFGGSFFTDMGRHPNRTINRWPYSSAAAGAYQFLPATWKMAQKALNLQDFKPHSQDQAALYLIRRRGALELADRGVMTKELVHKLAPEWASFPILSGRSYYRQPVKPFGLLKQFYDKQLARLHRETPMWSAKVAPPPFLQEKVLPAVATKGSADTMKVSNTAVPPVDCHGQLLCLLDQVAHGHGQAPLDHIPEV